MRILNVILFFLPFNLFAQSLSDGLLLHYEFDGDTEDSSTNTNHAVNFGATFVNDRFGNTNAAIHFDGVDDYINFPNISQLKPDLPVSFSFWIKYESYNINDREVFNTSFEEDRNTGVFFNSQASTGNYAVNFGDGSYSYVSSTRRSYVSNSAIDVGNWHQIVIVVTSANNMEIYFDCNESGGGYSGSGGSLQYSDLPGCIGRHDRALGVSANYFKGAIDDFRYWDRALTAENIAELLSSTLISSVAYIDPTDCGLDDGTIIISDLNLNANYTITYEYMGSGFTHSMQSDGSGGIVIVDLPEGIYEDIVIMDDSTGCSSSLGDIELTSPTLDATLSSIDPTDCDADDGSIIISGLLTNTEYTISYNDGSSQTETLFSDSNGEVILTDLASGLYQSISIEEVTTGCIDDLGQVMLIAPELNSEITWTDPTDCGLDDGTIIISDLNLNANYTITYEYMGSGFTHSMQSDGSGGIVIVDLSEGIYEDIVIMDDSTGCSSSLGDIELTSPTLDATLSSIDPTDCDADDGSIIISGLLTNTEYTISYNDGSSQTETLFSDSNGEVILTDLASGLYQSISIEEVTTGCIDDLGQVMLIAPELNSEITWTDPTDCGLDDGTIIISDLNLNANYTITYEYMGSGFTHSMQSDGSGGIVIVDLPEGIYEDIVIMDDSTGCSSSLGDIELTSPTLDATLSSIDPTDCDADDGSIIISGLLTNTEYTISYNDGSSQTETLFSDSNGEVILTDLASGLYQSISIEEVTTGCIDDLGQIDLECMGQEILCFKTKMFFTPNGDGFNDFWHLEMLSNSCDYILYIFNRYGKLLKTLTPFDDKWDGTYNGLNMPSSDYWYLVDYDNGQGNLQYKSHFTLKR